MLVHSNRKVHCTSSHESERLSWNTRDAVCVCRFSTASLKYTGRILSTFREVKAKLFFNLHFVFLKLKKNSSNSVMLPLYKEKAFPYTTQNLRKPQMELEVKPPKKIIC